jgi:hypothetical protein
VPGVHVVHVTGGAPEKGVPVSTRIDPVSLKTAGAGLLGVDQFVTTFVGIPQASPHHRENPKECS